MNISSYARWFCVKRSLPRTGNYDLARYQVDVILFFFQLCHSYLPVYLWKQMIKKAGGDIFVDLLKLLAKETMMEEQIEKKQVIRYRLMIILFPFRLLLYTSASIAVMK